MDDLESFDLDRSVARAWDTFRERLADHIAQMADDDYLILNAQDEEEQEDGEEAGEPHLTPYVQLCAFGEGAVRCEASSNDFLSGIYRLSDAGERALIDARWNAPDPDDGHGSPNYFIDLPLDFADQAAAMAIVALRDVWGVAHPTFLNARAWNDDGEIEFDVGRKDVGPEEVSELPLAIMPENRDEPVALVDRVLAGRFGRPPVKDDDGDIPVRSGSALVFVRVVKSAPVIEIFAPLVKSIANRTRAAEVLIDLNKRNRLVKFFLNGDYVIGGVALPALPFVPRHLTDMFSMFSKLAADIDEQLAKDLGGRLPFFQEESEADVDRVSSDSDSEFDDDEGLPSELQTLLELDAEGRGDLDPADIAHICGNDRDKILSFIRDSSNQEIEWRKSAELALSEGDKDEAAACKHEADAWANTVEELRAALRVVVIGSDDE